MATNILDTLLTGDEADLLGNPLLGGMTPEGLEFRRIPGDSAPLFEIRFLGVCLGKAYFFQESGDWGWEEQS